jgi:hypothetical protein
VLSNRDFRRRNPVSRFALTSAGSGVFCSDYVLRDSMDRRKGFGENMIDRAYEVLLRRATVTLSALIVVLASQMAGGQSLPFQSCRADLSLFPPVPLNQDLVRVITPQPNRLAPIALEISGFRETGPTGIVSLAAGSSGNTIEVTAQIASALYEAVPYCGRFEVGPLVPGSYSIKYSVANWSTAQGVYLPPQLVSTAAVVVPSGASAVDLPASTTTMLVLLALVVGAIGILQRARRGPAA